MTNQKEQNRKPATKEQIESAYDELIKQFSKMNRDDLIGFLLASQDDEVFKPTDNKWLEWTHEQLVEQAVTSYIEMAALMIQGKVFKSELRGLTPYGIA